MTGLYVPWLADAARLTGYPVVEVDGWRTRGHGGMRSVEGPMCHHTADGPGEYPSLRIVRDGRADLPGPLSAYGLARSGAIYVIAAGLSWHAGASQWAGFRDLNSTFLGIEAESAGTRDDWTAAQRDAYPRLCAAICYYARRGAERVVGHREACLPRGRKIDPAFIDMDAMRSRVADLLLDPLARIPRAGGAAPSVPTTPTIVRGADMIVPAAIRRPRPDDPKWFQGAFKVERGKDAAGGESRVFETGFVSVKATYGSASLRIAEHDSNGRVIRWTPKDATYATLPGNGEIVYEVAPGTRYVTVEGWADPRADVTAVGMGIARK